VVLKLTLGSGEATSPHAKAALGLGVLQDLTMIPLLALLPLLESEAGDILLQLAKSLGAATVSLVLVIVLGTRLVPRLLSFVSQTGARELFLLTILVIALGTAYAANQVGLSYALGAFLAGLVVSESEFDSHVLAEIIPLRDVFSTLFFVSLGMLIDPDFFFDHPGRIGAVVVVLVMGKILLSLAGFLLSGVGAAVATRAAILTGQIGEFSFVLASIGLSHLIIDDDQFSLILSIALASILVSPLALIAEPWLTPYVERLPFMRGRTLHGIDQDASYRDIRGHVVICGYGRVGRALALTLIRRELEFVVIEMNPAIVRDLQTLGIPALYGDSIGEPVLRRAGVEHAHVMAVTVPNTIGAVQTVRVAKRLNPDLYVVARAARAGELPDLRAVGANEIVQPEFEAGLEFLRHVLRSQDVSEREIERLVDHRRHMFYQEDNPMLALVALDERP
jgi:CPA2 family monovalent cation:H+ antiporter-2